MSSATSFLLGTLLIAVAILFAVLWRGAVFKRRRLARESATVEVARCIQEYFRKSQTEVAVACINRPNDGSVLALIDSAPQPRFRYSHIIEIGLRAHVRKTLGVELARVYWRFPIEHVVNQAGSAPPSEPPSVGVLLDAASRAEAADKDDRAVAEDSYLNARALKQKLGKEYQVTSTSWEQFEAARQVSDKNR